jgi:hypothetical protein
VNQAFTQSIAKQMTDELTAAVKTLGLEKYGRHIFLCADQTQPNCASKEKGLEAWEYLKKRLKELQLISPNRWFIGPKRTACGSAFKARLRWYIRRRSGIIRARRLSSNGSSKSI